MRTTRSTRTTLAGTAGLAATILLGLSACGDSDSPDADPAAATSPDTKSADPASSGAPTEACDVTDATTIQSVFGGVVGDGTPGHARDCVYIIDGGAATNVHVFYYGTAAELGGIKSGYQANRGPLSDLSGIGDDAFSPGDVGANEVVAQAGDTVFAIGISAVDAKEITPEVTELARRVADDLG
jgi:hypothetical protein